MSNTAFRMSNSSLRRQAGMGMYSWLIVILIIGIVLFQVFKLIPSYTESYYISSKLKELARHPGGVEELSSREIRNQMVKYFTVNNVSKAVSDSLDITRKDSRVIINMQYENRVPLFLNIDVVMKFHHQLDSQFPGDCCTPRDQ